MGTTVVISCKADGFPVPTVQWKQGLGGGDQSGDYQQIAYNNKNGAIESFVNGTLVIRNVTREHEGFFLCQATNGIGAGLSKLIRLTVNVGPHVIVRTKQISVKRGERVTLRCEADGDRPLEITWRSKNGQIAGKSYDMRYDVKKSEFTSGAFSELTIVQTILSDRGEYTCVATNQYGHDHSTINLQVQEPPNPPKNLHVNELKSRSVVLSWTSQDAYVAGGYADSQPVLRYIVQFKESQDVWTEYNQKIIGGEKGTAHVGSLKPATSYHFRIFAENSLGRSVSSDILHVQTDSEIPGGAPRKVHVEALGPTQLLVTWRAPDREHWNGEILGYAIGYQRSSGNAPDEKYNYSRMGTSGGDGTNEFRLTGLEKYTAYSVSVLAFNSKGDGPGSKPILGHTLEDVPSRAPQKVFCSALTAQNVQINWEAPPEKYTHGIVQGYKIYYEPTHIHSEYANRETKVTQSLSTMLHGLQPYTNYSVQVLAFTRAGEGVASPIVQCLTEEATPDAPERIKSVVTGDSSVIISWLPPRRPNGLLTLYTIFIRILEKGQELSISTTIVPAPNQNFFEAKNLKAKESYEAWVTASTKIGAGPSTPVVKLIPSGQVPAAIVNFGQIVTVSWKTDVKLRCAYVGQPKVTAEWSVADEKAAELRQKINEDNAFVLRNVQKVHESNYSCFVRNALGSDRITYQLYVQVPPGPPKLTATASSPTTISINWHLTDTGGSPIKNFLLTYRKQFGDWHEILLDRRASSHILEHLMCGSTYEFTIAALNKIGSGRTSDILKIKTIGDRPIAPKTEHFLRVNVTSVQLELTAWMDGGCPINYFTVEYRRFGYNSDWIVVSSNIAMQSRFVIGDLEPANGYSIRINAHNNAGVTVADYTFETLGIGGGEYCWGTT